MLLLALYPVLLCGIVWTCAFAVQFTLAPDVYRGAAFYSGAGFDHLSATTGRRASPAAFANNFIAEFWPIILTAVLVWFLVAWFANTKMIRMLSHSRPVSRSEEPELYNLLENLCIAQGEPMPRLEIIETHARNAFASGIDRKSFAITVTRGLLNSLTKDEVEAVLAHELAHIMNRDVRLLVISIIFTGLIGFAAQLAWSSFRTSLWTGGRGGRDRGGLIFVILAVMAVLWLGYIATLVTRFAISRKREYMADAGAVEMTKNPEAMMRALMRISKRDQIPETTADIAMMCTQNSKAFMGMFATHPPIDKRIAALSEATGAPVPDLQPLPASHAERFGKDAQTPNPWITRARRRL